MRMWQRALWIGVFGSLLWIPEGHSGPSMTVCDKAAKADVVVELKFTVKGRFPPNYLRRRWCPPMNRLTLKSLRVTRVLKGKLSPRVKLGRVLRGLGVTQWPECLRWWKTLYRQKTFTKVVFLKRRGRTWDQVGQVEESFSCIGPISRIWRPRKASQCKGVCLSVSHTSFCPFYKHFQAEVKRCLRRKIP